jgi:hypothetical protein
MVPVINVVIMSPVDVTKGWIEGHIQQGHGVASGLSAESPYPAGTINMQTPFFKVLGLDLSHYWQGTINLNFKPFEISLQNPNHTFSNMFWTNLHPPESFSFWHIKIDYLGDKGINGLIYYPHPETKSRHWQSSSTLEILAPYISNLRPGCSLKIKADDGCLRLYDGCRLRAKLLEFLKFRVLASPDCFFSESSVLARREWLKSVNPESLELPEADLDRVWNQAKILYTED